MSISRYFRRLITPASAGSQAPNPARAFDTYVDGAPSAQNLIDLLPGWNHSLPEFTGTRAGAHPFYSDPRIVWALEQFGSIQGKNILELGPLEASHTFLISQHGPKRIVAIEANKLALLKCLVVKEILNIRNAEFLLGDCQKWFEQSDEWFDLIFACGILYHMPEPVRLLTSICAHTDALMIWTHYFDENAMPVGDPRRAPFSGNVHTEAFHGMRVRLHERRYFQAQADQRFCGGLQDKHYWMERSQIIQVLAQCGFSEISISHEEPDHVFGPAFALFARRRSS
jgi:hypothetical protein